MRFFLTIVLAVFGQLTLDAQDFRNRIEAMQKEYATISAVHIEMKIQAFENKESIAPFFEELAIIKRSEANYYYRFSGTEMLLNEKYLLMIDESSRQIICTQRSLKKEEKFADPFTANLDSIMSFYETPVFVEKKENLEHFSVIQKEGPIRGIELFIDSKTSLLKRLDYSYENGQYVVIEFTIFNSNPEFGSTDFREGKYVRVENGKLKTTPLYSRFNLSVN